MSMPEKKRMVVYGLPVVVYGLPANSDMVQHNMRIGRAQKRTKDQVTVAFDDGIVVTVADSHCFFTSQLYKYFDQPRNQQTWVTEYTRVVVGENRNKHIVATKFIPAGSLLACSTQRVHLTNEEILSVEAEFMEFMRNNLRPLMGRQPHEPNISFEPNYSRALVFIGAVAARGTYGHPVMQTILSYDPLTPERLKRLWRRCDGQDLIWLKFWRCKLAPKFTAEQVFHIWHMVLNFPWPSLDQLTLIFGETVCFTECHPLRMAEYEKVMDGQQNANKDKYTNRFLSTFITNLPGPNECVSAYFLKDVQAGETLYADFGGIYVSDVCNTVFNFLFMNEKDGEQWLNLYKNIIRHFGEPVINSFQDYLLKNLPRTILTRNANRTQATGVRTTPTVYALPASPPTYMPPTYTLPTCYYCAKPIEHPKHCALCEIAVYCDKKCQTADWKVGHKDKCMPPQLK